MGIPAYFRWISERYPKMMADCVEFVDYDDDTGTERRIDASKPNPNGQEFDNLYLDMNGIIHPCTHPEDAPAPTTEEEMFTAVCNYIDRVFGIVRPRRVLYMAIDGVAPRAKINQQRSRRFRSVREAAEKAEEQAKLREEWRSMGLRVKVDDPDAPPPFDSNVITPGTPFMARLALALREYVADRLAHDPAWRNLRVIFSDASVPGEGEHKIAEFIRVERAQPGYDPAIRHVMYGLDADLIMLALTTHEAHFSILRELVFPKRGAQRNGKGPGGSAADPRRNGRPEPPTQIDKTLPQQFRDVLEADGLKTRGDIGKGKPFHFLHVHTLREYLEIEYRQDILKELQSVPESEVEYNLERVIDDFVFLCFFVGNDFLPHLPTLDIREGAVDFLIELYKSELPRVGYLTSDGGNVDFARVRQMLRPIGLKEDEIFKDRAQREADKKRRSDLAEKADREAAERRAKSGAAATSPGAAPFAGQKFDSRGRRIGTTLAPADEPLVMLGRNSNAAVAEEMRRSLGRRDSVKSPSSPPAPPGAKRKAPDSEVVKPNSTNADAAAAAADGTPKRKRKHSAGDADVGADAPPAEQGAPASPPTVEKSKAEFSEELYQRMRAKNEIKNPQDNVKLGTAGWKDRYYEKKFGWAAGPGPEKDQLLKSYLEGLYWVMKYYYVGCVSWGWYYPYHYAPFASDLVASPVVADDIALDLGEPFRPFTQLQAVMPASSGKLVLPTCYSDLMTRADSPILDYYPETFDLDLNGKRFAWQGVALLPFIDEKRLSAALAGLDPLLTAEERARNAFGDPHVAVHRAEPLGAFISGLDAGATAQIPADVAHGQFFGTASGPLPATGRPPGPAVFAVFRLPDYVPHSSALLPTAKPPPPALDNVSSAGLLFTGWKQARFGILGQAARALSDKRYGRKRAGRGGRGGRGGGRGGRGGGRDRDHARAGHRGSGGGSGGGGSGGGGSGGRQDQPREYGWGGGRAARGGAHQDFGGAQRAARPGPRQPYDFGRGGHRGGGQPGRAQWQQGAYARGGGGFAPPPPQQQGWHGRAAHHGGGGGGYAPPPYAPQPQWARQGPPAQHRHYPRGAGDGAAPYAAPYVPGNYGAPPSQQQHFHQQQPPQQAQHYPPPGGGSGGGGLAGPTAANLRQGSMARGRGRDNRRRDGGGRS